MPDDALNERRHRFLDHSTIPGLSEASAARRGLMAAYHVQRLEALEKKAEGASAAGGDYVTEAELRQHAASPHGAAGDHGQLLGLADDDHAQYLLVDGSRDMTGNLNVEKADPEQRLTDTGDSEYSRVVRADTGAVAARYNRVYKPGDDGYGLHFDGVDDGCSFTSHNLGTVHSVSFWVNFAAYPSGNWGVAVGDTDPVRMAAFFGGNVEYCNGVSPAGHAQVAHGTVNNGTWYHFAVVRNGTSVKFYKDGAQIGTTQTLTDNSSPTVTRVCYYGSLHATLDEVRVYAKELSDAEVLAHYNSGSGQYGAPESYLVAGWHMDNNTDDYSGNAHSLTLNSSPGYVLGKVSIPGGDTEVQVWRSEDGGAALEEGIQTFGDADGRTVLQGKSLRGFTAGVERARLTDTGLGLGVTVPTARLSLPATVAAADGIDFGGDVALYRGAADLLRCADKVRSDVGFNVNGADGVASSTFDVVTALQFAVTTLQYKKRSITVTGGIVTAVGAESAWTDVPTA